MRRIAWIFIVALALVLLAPARAAAGTTFDVDVLWTPDPDSDTQVFLHATNVAYPLPRPQVAPVFRELRNPYDDYPVLAFIAFHGHVDIGTVWAFRRNEHSWFQCMLHFGVRPDALFVALPHDPGPPYGKAYGHWRKHGDKMKPKMVRDEDVRFWVRTRTAARFARVTPSQAWEWHQQGRAYERVTSARYKEQNPGRGHGKGQPPGHANKPGRGHGQDKKN